MKGVGAGATAKMNLSSADAHEAGNFIISQGDYRITADGRDLEVGK